MIDEVEIYKAIGEETRLRIMRLLVKSEVELCACELIDVLEKPQYTISKSLGVLVNTGLILERREGRMMFYQLNNASEFNKTIFENIKLIKCCSNDIFKNDFIKLNERLSLRESGKCVKCDC
jgi:ArsR family transcriptional regulator, arsenate/arsenite/antimonite-responsive transcriptional repressor